MSQSQHSGDASPALGSRENFFDHNAEDYDSREDTADEDPDAEDYIDPLPSADALILREQWRIDHYLRKHPEAQLFCPYCWHELDAESVLSDPEEYVPESEVVTDPRYRFDPEDEHPDAPTPSESVAIEDLDYGTKLDLWTEPKYGDHRQHRACGACGGVSWGGVLGDLTTEQFLDCITDYLASKQYLSEREGDRVRDAARQRKQGGMADRDNRTHIAYHVGAGLVEDS